MKRELAQRIALKTIEDLLRNLNADGIQVDGGEAKLRHRDGVETLLAIETVDTLKGIHLMVGGTYAEGNVSLFQSATIVVADFSGVGIPDSSQVVTGTAWMYI